MVVVRASGLRQHRLRRGARRQRPRHPDPAHGAAGLDARRPGRQRVPGHGRRRADRRPDPGRAERDRLPGRPYVGMAKVSGFLHAANDVLAERGLQLPLPGQSTTTSATRLEHGLAVQKQIVGAERVDAMYHAAPDDEQHLQRYLSANCFGDYLTRSGIDVPTRELLTFAMLASLGGCDAQVKGHIVGNLNVGNDRARLLSVLTVLIPFIGYPRTLNALRALDEVAPADRNE